MRLLQVRPSRTLMLGLFLSFGITRAEPQPQPTVTEASQAVTQSTVMQSTVTQSTVSVSFPVTTEEMATTGPWTSTPNTDTTARIWSSTVMISTVTPTVEAVDKLVEVNEDGTIRTSGIDGQLCAYKRGRFQVWWELCGDTDWENEPLEPKYKWQYDDVNNLILSVGQRYPYCWKVTNTDTTTFTIHRIKLAPCNTDEETNMNQRFTFENGILASLHNPDLCISHNMERSRDSINSRAPVIIKKCR